MDSDNLEYEWNRVCDRIKSYGSINEAQINAFFSRMKPQAMSEGFLLVTAPSDFLRNWIERHYTDYIKQALKDLYGVDFLFEIAIDASGADDPSSDGTAMPVERSEQTGTTNEQGQNPFENRSTTSAEHAEAGGRSAAAAFPANASSIAPNSLQEKGISQPEHPRQGRDIPSDAYTFENFVIGDSNRMAYSMAVHVAEAPGKSIMNPLFIYGKSGLGKTHLMRAIQNYVHENLPGLRTVYVDSAELLSDYTDASAAHDKDKHSYRNFKNRYLDADILLIDDIQWFQGKKQTLDIVFQIFNSLTDQGKQVVLSADRAPKNIDIDERYITRFNSGGTFDIQPPEVETKMGIVKSFIEEYAAASGFPRFTIPDDAQRYIAENSSSNIRELKSAVTKVIYHINAFHKQDISPQEVRDLLENHFSSGPTKKLTIEDIQREVESYYKISHADLVGNKRPRNITYARQVAMYLSRTLLDEPYAQIGKSFGGRDHTTVMYSVNTVEERMRENRETREELETIRQMIRDQ